jgi:MFS superfamily sulfate permease-like transporter
VAKGRCARFFVSGLHALEEVHDRFRKKGIVVLLSGIRAQPLRVLEQSGALERIGPANVLGSFVEASVRAWEVVDEIPGGDEGERS